MIRLRRGKAPSALSGPNCKGAAETARAIALFAKPRRTAAFEFVAYRDNSVKAALNAMSGYKCAYCETRYGATQPVDIEHYRPKGPFRDSDGTEHTGYYWLAASWDNLLPSCIDCNRRRRHGSRGSYGKASMFPIKGARATAPGEERFERRLLLHPCRDNPTLHLWFLPDGGVIPRRTATGRSSIKGRTSIEVYGLQRPQLVRERAAYIRRVLFDIEMAERAAVLLANQRDAQSKEILRLQLRRLVEYLEPQSPYVAIGRQFVVPALQRMGISA